MAKKSTTKKEKVEVNTDVVENVINNIIEESVPSEVLEITEKLEEIKPTDAFVEEVIAHPETAEEVLAEKIEELNKLEERVQEEIQKVATSKKKQNSWFTYTWNGVNLYE